MTRITYLEWYEENVLHIARHQVSPEEVEEICFYGSPHIERGRGGLYYITGQTHAGRYLLIVVRLLGHGSAKVITARDMDLRSCQKITDIFLLLVVGSDHVVPITMKAYESDGESISYFLASPQ